MAVVQTTWQCPCCGAMLAVVGPSEPPEEWERMVSEGSPTRKRGGRPAGSKNRPKVVTPAAALVPRHRADRSGKDGEEPTAGAVGIVKGGE